MTSMTAQIGISSARLLDVCRDVIFNCSVSVRRIGRNIGLSTFLSTPYEPHFGILSHMAPHMADRESSLLHQEKPRSDESPSEKKVEAWRSHPSHKATTSYQ